MSGEEAVYFFLSPGPLSLLFPSFYVRDFQCKRKRAFDGDLCTQTWAPGVCVRVSYPICVCLSVCASCVCTFCRC